MDTAIPTLTPRPIKLEFVEPVRKQLGAVTVHGGADEIVVPSRVLINGQAVMVPGDPEIEFGGLDKRGPLTVRMTMYVSEIHMGAVATDE